MHSRVPRSTEMPLPPGFVEDAEEQSKGNLPPGFVEDSKPAPKALSAAAPQVSFLDQPLPGGTLPGPAGGMMSALSAMGVTPRGAIHALPAIGAGAATLLTGGAAAPALLPAMAAAGLGGAGGSFLSQGAEAALGGEGQTTSAGVLGEAGKEGAIGALTEPLGGLVGGAVKLAGRGLSKLAAPAASAAGKMAESLGLAPAISGIPKYLLEHTWLGRKIAGEAERTGVDRASAALAEQARILNVPPPPPGLDAKGLSDWTRGALKGSADRQAEEAALLRATQGEANTAYKEFAQEQTAAFKDSTAKAVEAAKLSIIKGAEAGKSAARADLDLTRSLGRRAAENVRMKLSSQVDQELLSIGATLEPEFVGLATKGAVERGTAIGARQAKELYGAAEVALRDATVPGAPTLLGESLGATPGKGSVDLRATLETVRDRMSANPAMRDSVLKEVVERFLGSEAEVAERAAGIAKGGKLGLLQLPEMPFAQVRELQKAVASRMPGFNSQATRDAQGLAKFLWRDLTSAMEEGTAGTAGGEALKLANDYYRGYMGVMKRGFIPKVVKTSPEFVVDLLKDADVTKPRLLREAVLGYAEKYGSASEKIEAREAWDTLRASYLRKRLFKGGPEKLGENLDAVGSPVIKELFDTGPLPGQTRLYRGQPELTPDYIRNSEKPIGRWFTPDKVAAEQYANPYSGGQVVSVDVPNSVLGTSGFTGPRAGSEFVIPRSLANQATRVSPPSPALGNLRRIGDTLKQLGPRVERLTSRAEAEAASRVAGASASRAEKLATLKGSLPKPPVFPALAPVPPPPIPPEVLAAQSQTSLIGQALKGSHAGQAQSAGVGGLSYGHASLFGPVAYGMHFFGMSIMGKALPVAATSEALGGLIAKAMYSPKRTAQLVSALSLMGRQGTAGAARLAALELEWSGRGPAKKPSKPTYFPDLSAAISKPPPPPPSLGALEP